MYPFFCSARRWHITPFGDLMPNSSPMSRIGRRVPVLLDVLQDEVEDPLLRVRQLRLLGPVGGGAHGVVLSAVASGGPSRFLPGPSLLTHVQYV
jgi:hypothetical protein